MKLRITLIAFLLIASTLGSLWWYQATRREKLLEIDLPGWSVPVMGYYYGIGKDERIKIYDDGKMARLVTYSVAIHKSQINPWFTLWREEIHARIVNGKLEFAGASNFPLSRK